MNMRIGITERGDAALDFGWIQPLKTIEGAVLITKNVTDKFIQHALAQKDKIVLHATTTGFGGTIIEPNVPNYKTQLSQVRKLVDAGFPLDHVVIRIDPMIPTAKGLQTAQKVVDEANRLGFHRFRFSSMDMYPHVRVRFQNAGVPLPYGNSFSAPDEMFDALAKWLESQDKQNAFECCAEPKLANCSSASQTGCISQADLDTLGVSTTETFATGLQRSGCLCLSCKTELLNGKKRCPHQCLYCYWKD